MIHFESHDQQESADLEYGGQAETCRRLAAKDLTYEDASIDGEWTPDED